MSTESDALDRSVLERKGRDELHQIATALGVSVTSRAKKADIVEAILDDAETSGAADGESDGAATSSGPTVRRTRVRSNGGRRPEEPVEDGPGVPEPEVNAPDVDGPDEEPKAEWEMDVDEGDEAKGGSDRSPRSNQRGSQSRTRSRAGGDAGDAARDDDADADGDDKGDAGGAGQTRDSGGRSDGDQESDERGADGQSRRRRRRGRDRDRDDQFQGEPQPVEGTLDLRDEGYGFLRTRGYVPSREDVYVPAKLVRQLGLRRGDVVTGASRPAARNEKNPALLRVDAVNALDPEEAGGRREFDDLTPVFPTSKLTLAVADDPDNLTGRAIDLLAPIGMGQRSLVIAPPQAGKTTVLRHIATGIETNHPDVELVVLLLDERPEEVSDMARAVQGTVVASTFDRPPEEHAQVAELTIESAKRMVEDGKDVVVIADGLTRLARAYNIVASPTGRALPGGLDAAAIYPTKRFFGAARAFDEGGSLTIIATVVVETGSAADQAVFDELGGTANMELRLDRLVAERGIFPAIDVASSHTRHLDQLVAPDRLAAVERLRAELVAAGGRGEAMTLLRERLATSDGGESLLTASGDGED